MSDSTMIGNWDLSSYFSEFDGPEMKSFKSDLEKDIDSLLKTASGLDSLSDDTAPEWEAVILAFEDLSVRLYHIWSYVECLSSADSKSEAYQKEEAELTRTGAEFEKLHVELLRSVKEVSDTVFEAFAARNAFEGVKYALDRIRRESKYMMSSDREALAADLGVDGIAAWGRLYETVSGKLEFDMQFPDGRKERLSISQRRSLMDDPDRRVRQAAFFGGNQAWEQVEDVAAAALNAISGTRLTLNGYRGVPHFLENALFQSGITQKTLDAMFEAIESERDLSKQILRLKAKIMGLDRVAWYDLAAPLGLPDQEKLPWDQAKSLVQTAFDHAYPELGSFTQKMYDKEWIDWEPRSGKRPGGFCTGSLITRESRIFMTYNQNLSDVRTLAHEAGHAFHSYVMRELRPLANDYPMTLAETASTFGEMILTEGVIEDPDMSDANKALMLDMEVCHGAIYMMDIPVRYAFEKAMYEERSRGELSVTRFKELMVETQQEIFGDVLAEGGEDPFFWASKLHFYITGVTFYNFPYTFGFLLSRGLFSLFKQEGADFLPRYEAFLRNTGSDTAENVARKSIGQDLEAPDFWVEAIQSFQSPLSQLETLLPRVLPNSN